MTMFVYVNTSKQVGDLAWSSRSTGCCTSVGIGR
jgi:hypothetical protein